MRGKLNSLLLALVTGLGTPVAGQGTNIGYSGIISFGDENLTTEQQVDIIGQDSVVSGSIFTDKEQEDPVKYGVRTSVPENSAQFGDYKGKSSTSYYQGTSQRRNNNTFLGVRTNTQNRRLDGQKVEYFAGTNLKEKIFVDSFKGRNREEHRIYTKLGNKLIGFADEDFNGVDTTGFYVAWKRFAAQHEIYGDNSGTRITFSDILGGIGEGERLLGNDRLNAEFELGEVGDKRGLSYTGLNYSMLSNNGLVKRMNLGVGIRKGEYETQTRIQNSMRIGDLDLDFSYEPKDEKFRLDFNLKF